MPTASYVVTGMTCQHCVQAVTEEVGAVPGVSDVSVDLESGRLTVVSSAEVPFAAISSAEVPFAAISSAEVPFAAIATAVDEAGYAVAPG